jgi:CRISPR-associated endonuclease/helicase Cas3
VLVIDEIHAMDAYQNALVEALLRFQAALGGSAILISATLTLAARQRLAAAFAAGAQWRKPVLAERSFPLATIIDAHGPRETPVEPSRGSRRDLPVTRLDTAAAAIQLMAEAARDGRAAVWIRNTVQDARDAHRDLTALLPDCDVGLFHARFALGDRLTIQEGVLENFGKHSSGLARQRILVATQVVEQSLDCDWDVMITDLAPIDLIIQRAGRLHRHDHRPQRPPPVLYVVAPEPVDDAGTKWYETAFPRGAFVYPHHGRLWLTMKVLLDAGGLNLASGSPRDVVERVYAADAVIPKGLEQPSGKAEGRMSSERAVGRMNALELTRGYVHHAGEWESDTRTPTRLGDPTRSLRLARWEGGKLRPWIRVEGDDMRRAWRLSEVSVLAARAKDIAPPDAALAQAIKAEIATWPERYDPPLLVPLVADSAGEWGADIINGGDQPMRLRYSAALGLSFEAP